MRLLPSPGSLWAAGANVAERGRGARATTWAHLDGLLAGHDRIPPRRRRAGKAPPTR
jgi:hypothetical protein